MAKSSNPKSGYITRRFRETGLDVGTIADYLGELVGTDPRNALPEGDNVPIWEAPVVGIASAADPLFDTLAQPHVVGPIHVKADHWLAGAKSVISFFAPFSREIKQSYDRESALPSLEWVSGRLNGEVFINVMRRSLVRFLELRGGRAAAPNLDPAYKALNWLPMWSERHVAFIAGVGTFGLHAGLLTEKGAAGRIGSVVTDLELEPTPRPYTDIYEYCPWMFDGTCGACIRRCPVGAIHAGGKDHRICVTNGDTNIRPEFKEWGYHSCGHCQNNLPCSDRLPKRKGT
ncbi:epoxyqueuosine reductase [Telmatospirillum siberiense]|uniref:4Fe-4S ferredoxin n=1 Tax=Telmatospirillum siberiense TaxID=382514 RepID=A0A2N3PNT5_9PROT|nr:epoxyqueuosine reductase [Telmatospirillum siberiense]PKU22069.1 4Fe-4S ferredoxin [Telmatospirillum siberiense]